MKRFSVVKIGNGKWAVFDALQRARVWECRTREAARKFADSQKNKERLRTTEIVSIERLSDYQARIAREGEQNAG